ncbi:MAG TPA: glycosyltransferase family 4 protein [Acidimicrobiales bacterium]
MSAGRALQVLTSDRRRGAETFGRDLAADLAARGIDAPVVALAASGASDPLPVDAFGLRALRAEARACDVVVAHGSRTLPACALALAGTGVPFVYRGIGDPRVWSGRGLRRWRTTLLLRRPALVTALWPGAADALVDQHGVPRERIRVVGNGVPAPRCPVPDAGARRQARRHLRLPDDAPVVGFLGSLTPEKCVGAAVAAIGQVQGAHLLVAGDGPERAALEVQAVRDAPGRVRFAGVVAGAGPVLAAADAVVLPSRTEGLPGVLIEAGLSALPVVATAVGGVAEVVADGETGVLVPPGDVDRLAAGLRRVLGTEGPALGRAGRERCLARFEMGVIGARWAGILAEVAGWPPVSEHGTG